MEQCTEMPNLSSALSRVQILHRYTLSLQFPNIGFLGAKLADFLQIMFKTQPFFHKMFIQQYSAVGHVPIFNDPKELIQRLKTKKYGVNINARKLMVKTKILARKENQLSRITHPHGPLLCWQGSASRVKGPCL